MKKGLILLFMVISCLNVHAENINSDPYKSKIIEVRQNLGKSLNEAVKAIKDLLIERDEQLKSQTESLEELKEIADQIQKQTENPESNTTILKHGKPNMSKCSTDEELQWTGSKWVCKTPDLEQDCNPASTEYKRAIAEGYECYKDGAYEFEDGGWGLCNNSLGERYTVPVCMFDNSKTSTNPDYQVADSNCKNSIQEYEQPCGPNGDESTCKCPDGFVYVYEGRSRGRVSEWSSYEEGSASCKPQLSLLGKIESDMKYVVSGNNIHWGTVANNYWSGYCKMFTRYLKFDNSANNIKKFVLTKVGYDDHIWVYINGTKIYTGPFHLTGSDGLNLDYWKNKKGTNAYFHLKYDEAKSYKCELKRSDRVTLNKDLTKYLNKGENIIEMQTLVYKKGEGFAEFNVQFKNSTLPLPICKKQ